MNVWDELSFKWSETPTLVVELGGFHGRWAFAMYDRYHSPMHIFEPQLWLVDELREGIAQRGAQADITVHPYGLLKTSGVRQIFSFGTDGASVVSGNGSMRGTGDFKAIETVLEESPELRSASHMLINVEGAEYEIIDEMIRCKWFPSIVMVQFHLLTDEHAVKYLTARDALLQHYTLLWDFGTTLSAWERKP